MIYICGFSKQTFQETDKNAANKQENTLAPVFPRDNKEHDCNLLKVVVNYVKEKYCEKS